VSSGDTATPLVTLTSMDPIRVTFTLPERILPQLRDAMDKPGDLPVRVLQGDQSIATGKLIFIDSAVDSASGTITAKGLFANPDFKLWPGHYVDVEVDTSEHADALVAPAVAVQQGQRGPYVFIAKADGTAELRDVKTGASDADRLEILSGLTAGEQVIVEGQQRLTNGSKINTKSAAAAQKLSEAQPATATDKD
jgi:multidrug efflux system membrane fusion protein